MFYKKSLFSLAIGLITIQAGQISLAAENKYRNFHEDSPTPESAADWYKEGEQTYYKNKYLRTGNFIRDGNRLYRHLIIG